MSCRCTQVDLQTAKERCRGYEYALLYMISELIFSRTENLGDINWDECQEARFFSDKAELHMFSDGEQMRAVLCEETDQENQGDREFVLKGKHMPGKNVLVVREYYDFDEDGQMYVAKTRLAAVRQEGT